MNTLHLFWIVPLSVLFGAMAAALVASQSIRRAEAEAKKAYKQGLQDGMRFML